MRYFFSSPSFFIPASGPGSGPRTTPLACFTRAALRQLINRFCVWLFLWNSKCSGANFIYYALRILTENTFVEFKMLHKWAVSTINSIDHNILGKQYVLKAYLAYLKDQCWYFKWRRAWLYGVRPIRYIPRQHNICFRARIARRVIKIPRTHHADITSRHDRAISLYFFSIRNPFWHISLLF